MKYRSDYCGHIDEGYETMLVKLSGWVQNIRSLGGMTFIDLRDYTGHVQLVFNDKTEDKVLETLEKVKSQYVICVTGFVNKRQDPNYLIPTGMVEVIVSEMEILNECKSTPFTIIDDTDGGEEIRMKYRYLDLRRPEMQKNILFRNEVQDKFQKALRSRNFTNIETPYLIKSTPEGAKDFVVPSSMNEGQHYALPQSPQTMKQLLMVSGFDRYYQIVRCFRDEALRSDRQPEFTQIDCEASFVDEHEIISLFSGVMIDVLFFTIRERIKEIPIMSYDTAMKFYGNDKPDLRYDMTINDLSSLKQKGFTYFDEAESIQGICAPKKLSRKEIDKIQEWLGEKVVWVKSDTSSVKKFYDQSELEFLQTQPEETWLILAGNVREVQEKLGKLRLHLIKELEIKPEVPFAPVWITDFPLFEWNEEQERWTSMHHPFTAPQGDLEGDISTIKAQAYDFVINGQEIGGGSIRINNREQQEKVFELLGFTPEEAEEQFGFLMEAFEYGAPPHGGIAFGLDRLCAVLSHKESIRDFIAFPKNNKGKDTMLQAPSVIMGHFESELSKSGKLIDERFSEE